MEVIIEQGRQRKGEKGGSHQLPGKRETEAKQDLAEREAEAWWTVSIQTECIFTYCTLLVKQAEDKAK